MPYIVLDLATAAPAPLVTAGAPLTNEGETLGSLRAELFAMLGQREDVTTERYNLWINQAYLDLASSLQLETLKAGYEQVTVAGQPLYRLPGAVAATTGASLVDPIRYPHAGGEPLIKSSLSEYRGASTRSGRPRAYFREGKMLVFWPTPDAAYHVAVDYRVRPEYLTADAHSPIVPLEYHEAILQLARQKGFAALKEFDKSVVANNDAVGLIRRKKDQEAEEDTGRIVMSSVPRSRRDLSRTNTPRELGD